MSYIKVFARQQQPSDHNSFVFLRSRQANKRLGNITLGVVEQLEISLQSWYSKNKNTA